MQNTANNALLRYVLTTVALIITVFLLVVGKPILLPLVLALVVWYFIISLAKVFEKYKVPRFLTTPLSVVTCFFIAYLVYILISRSINDLFLVAPDYQNKFESLLSQFFTWSGIEATALSQNMTEYINFGALIRKGTEILTMIASNTMMILIYLLFIFLEYKGFNKKLASFLADKDDYDKTHNTLDKISNDINVYIKVKTLSSLLTGVLSYIVLIAFGVDFAEFWAFALFILNYIPTIGSFIGVFFPALLALIQFPSFFPPVMILILLTLIQVVTSNFMEPRMMGRSLNISPLVIILSLALWGAIWGIVGMILCVPITVIINIILARFKKTRPVAILLSEKGEIE